MDNISQPPERTAQLAFAMVGGIMLLSLLFYALLTIARLQLAQPADASARLPTSTSLDVTPAQTPAQTPSADGLGQLDVRCSRAEDAPGGVFTVTATPRPTASSTLVVAVDVIDADGVRTPHTVRLAVLAEHGAATATVPNSGVRGAVACVVAAIQLDDQVIITGN